MDDFETFSDEEFFIIDKDNLEAIEEKLYGFAIQDNKVVFNSSYDSTVSLSPNGTYVYVKVLNDEIIISQDFNGGYGLYLYQDDDYFAISNSFLKLVEYLKLNDNINLTLNKECADAFLFSDLYSFVYKETLVNEIVSLKRNDLVKINKKERTLNIEEIDYQENTVPIDSKEGLEILDNWHNRWVDLLRSIASESNNLCLDLSGGFDTRILSTLWLNANINLDKLVILSIINNKVKILKEDYEIASEIAEHFGFKLNQNQEYLRIKTSLDYNNALNRCFYVKLGFHKDMPYENYEYDEPIYKIRGGGGASLRGHPNKSPEEYKDFVANFYNDSYIPLKEPSLNILDRTLNDISSDVGIDIDSKILPHRHYLNVMGRNHHGKNCCELYFSNQISLNPLLDSELYKLKFLQDDLEHNYLLIALIYLRYCPELLNFKIQGDREIDKETIALAKEINDSYPYTPIERDFIEGPELKTQSDYVSSPDNFRQAIKTYLVNVFYSRSFKEEFLKHYPPKVYYVIARRLEVFNHHYVTHLYSAFAVLKIIMDIELGSLNKDLHDEWFNQFLDSSKDMNELISDIYEEYYDENNDKALSSNLYELSNGPEFSSLISGEGDLSSRADFLLSRFNTSKIDIKNKGISTNRIEILDISDDNSDFRRPSWLKNKTGEGIMIHSYNNSLDLKFKCINDGTLEISLRALSLPNFNKVRLPVYINYTKFIVCDEIIFDSDTIASHDESYRFKMEVKDSDIITIHVEWLPINYFSPFYDNVKSLKNKVKSLEKENKKLKKQNKKYKKKLDSVLNSNSWKLTKVLRVKGRIKKSLNKDK